MIVNSRGLHARPSSQLAKLAAGFKSKITVKKGDKQADASSVTSLLMLVAPKNTELTIVAKGEDEKEAAAAVLELIAGGFGDGVDSPAVAENPPPADEPPARAMQKIDGVAAGRGAVCGRVHLRLDKAEVPRYQLTAGQIAAEQKRFDAALKKARRELHSVQKKIAEMDGAAEMSPFVHLYRTLLEDPALIKKIHDTIAEQQCNAEWAVKQRGDAVSARFLNIDDSYLRERGADVRHVMRRLLAAMKPGATKKPSQTAGYIVVAAELDPAHIIVLRQRGYAGFATETGGVASHAAILARSIGMPAIVGAKGLLAAAENGDDIVLDMDRGAAVLRPDAAALADYKKTRAAPAANKVKSKSAAKKTVGIKTEDGQAISLQANIELPDETGGVLESGADGVGLLRTEFLFLNRDEPPGEDEQFEIYRRVLRDVAPRPVVARTLDLGLDKTGGGFADSSPLGMAGDSLLSGAAEIIFNPVAGAASRGKGARQFANFAADDFASGRVGAKRGIVKPCPRAVARRPPVAAASSAFGRDDRSACGGVCDARAVAPFGFFLHRHQRLDSVCAGGRPRRRAFGALLRASASGIDSIACEELCKTPTERASR